MRIAAVAAALKLREKFSSVMRDLLWKDFITPALNGRMLKQARNGTDGEVERGFSIRPLSASRLAESHGGLVCPVSEYLQESRTV
jgi:hypothetical protein